MKKQPKQFFLLLVALVVLVGGYFGLRAYNKASDEKAEQALEEAAVTMIDAKLEEVTAFSYDHNGETYAYEKENGIWYYAPDHSLKLQQGLITGMLEKCTPLVSCQKIENVTDYDQYGLGETAKTVTIRTEDAEYTVYVGIYNSITAACYFKMEGDGAVYVTTSPITGTFNKTVNELMETTQKTAVG